MTSPAAMPGFTVPAAMASATACDVRQALLDDLDKRVPGGQDQLAACGGLAKQSYRVSYPARGVLQVRQVDPAGQGVRMVGPEDPLRFRAGLLEELQR